jgi:hypothetical protein
MVAAIYLVIACLLKPQKSISDMSETLLIMAEISLLPLACIWFVDELGDYVSLLPGACNHETVSGLVGENCWLVPVPAACRNGMVYLSE